MSERVTMPALGESVTEGTVTRWLKSVGDSVEVDEPLLEVSTDKVDTEIPSPVAGTLTEILAEEDETVEVGADLAVIGDADEADSSSDDSGSEDEDADEEPQQDEPQDSGEESSKDEESEAPKQEKKSSSGGDGGGERVPMPALGESVTEGTVTRWLKSEGDQVEVDEPLLEVSTDKVDTEIPSPVAGTLTKILVEEDETVEVGADLAVIGGEASGGSGESDTEDKDESDTEDKKESDSAESESKETAEETPVEPSTESDEPKKDESAKKDEKSEPKQDEPKKDEPKKDAPKSSSEPPSKAEETDASAYVTPLVRKLAADHDVDLTTLSGTGVGGRIRKQDVLDAAKAAEEAKQAASAPAPQAEKAAAPAAQAPAPQQGKAAPSAVPAPSDKRGTTEKMTRLRKVIAERMVNSLQVSAQLTAVVEVDMSRIAALRARTKSDFERREGVKLSYLPFISLATVETLKAFPTLNSSVDGDQVVFHGGEHLGIAVDTERGLLVPVVRDAGDLNIAGLARKIADIAERTRTNKVTPDELGGGTFTISNIGSNGSLLDTPIINQPQVAILGTGAIVKRPVVVQDEYGNDSIAIRHMQYLVLTYDHRVVDGADAGRFLSALKSRLEEGAFEV
ncbi:2-oxoglutarate dehydrogenase, E2 component, dihydrolipoamide succinyltransferase [Mobilicoccus caccae]|uniref:Dihydrolipoamide acetyltransferase component of pyruvate dehydrogenase complex n=1 Tax=Mobilicoccus caccae TaxID=1859295 RepID=A0ABQ6IRR2_9MICO|nr:2-oxoglutarate dehydrogenase, E2 component, dihydrolipoamide succinyltransferase [Mobilicoccus caccae]GMA39404.1 dihydrolipoamide acetyltransferase component of pyruvate dehydrogenase complex [Mobilicoccus caccae]